VSFFVRFGGTPEPEGRLRRMQARAGGMSAGMADRFGPSAQHAREMAAQRMMGAREWSAPQLHRAARYVEEDLGPRVGSMLTAGARRIEPARTGRRTRNIVIGLCAVAGVAVVAGVLATRWNAMHGMGEGDVVQPEQFESIPPVPEQEPAPSMRGDRTGR
jgi:hypothetical protein